MSETPHTSDQGSPDQLAAYKRGLADDIAAKRLSTEEIQAALAQVQALEKGNAPVIQTEPVANSDEMQTLQDPTLLGDAERHRLAVRLTKRTTPIDEVEEIGDIAKRAGPPVDHP